MHILRISTSILLFSFLHFTIFSTWKAKKLNDLFCTSSRHQVKRKTSKKNYPHISVFTLQNTRKTRLRIPGHQTVRQMVHTSVHQVEIGPIPLALRLSKSGLHKVSLHRVKDAGPEWGWGGCSKGQWSKLSFPFVTGIESWDATSQVWSRYVHCVYFLYPEEQPPKRWRTITPTPRAAKTFKGVTRTQTVQPKQWRIFEAAKQWKVF